MAQQKKAYVYVTGNNGLPVRGPADRIKDWQKAQSELQKGKGKAEDGQAKPLLVAIHDNATEDRAPANRIASIYGIGDIEAWLEGQMKRNVDFVIYDKSKADKMLSSYSHNTTLESKIRFAAESISDNEAKSNPKIRMAKPPVWWSRTPGGKRSSCASSRTMSRTSGTTPSVTSYPT